jgi:thiol-disulfide isomerase/thioredoxin
MLKEDSPQAYHQAYHQWSGPVWALTGLLLLVLGLAACQRVKEADPIAGTWQAVVLNKAGEEVAFVLELRREGDQLIGTLVNGDDRIQSTSGSFDGKELKLGYDFYDGELIATLEGGQLHGSFRRQWRKELLVRQLRAWREDRRASADVAAASADLSGDWILRVGEGEEQKFWRAAFRQSGTQVTGTIIPPSGDWGTLTGTFENGQLRLSRFDGINAHLFKAQLTGDGKLEGVLDSTRKAIGERAERVDPAILAALPDPFTHTRMKHPSEPFRFSFPDYNGQLVSSADERFRNKALIVTIMGSWCPNCHDEAPVLNELYERYNAKGLEIVGLAFEYTGDVKRDSEQLKVFARRHKVKYPLLLAGTTENIEQQLPQLTNLGIYPTTIFIGRDGLVKKIHVGFEGPATGRLFVKLKEEMQQLAKYLVEE